ncbi:IS110 family RNA-guided transposase [Nonomuraea glycinis]|uniref:IS110 family transposase n=1 Tax=Nonomuraea glycinis TaxID=2047744 RepID=UPI002E1098B6|nr:IS110 family transposase [Nonomuraea glycinis]WSG65299.1 IS110 family transposase [Nonomuraea glycinis]WSG66465.1 IS110 family transposase [Nonomuraea glycinis]WSG67936.1 IS110 family transposase [Nonomuraea glycinis]WSG69420.1 IS110 family transposase [Nonomuraea glycinis]
MALQDCVYYVGIDWGSAEHAVCVLDEAGRVKTRFTIAHTAAGFADLARRLGRLGEAEQLPIGIERPDGRLVDVLLEAGHPVVPVKSNAIKAWRDAEVLSGAKSDAGDAHVIAEYLRLRQHKLTPARPFSGQTKALRTVVRTRDDIIKLRVMATNMLSALLDAFWPGAKEIFADVESPIALAFLTAYPTPVSAARLGEKRIASFCAKHGYSGKRPAAQLLARLRSAPPGATGEAETAAGRDAVLALVTVLTTLGTVKKELDRSTATHLAAHPDAQVFTSLPRSGLINAAQILAEWGDARSAYDGPDAVAAFAGVAPVTKASGRHHAVGYRWACNKRLRQAITTFAGNSRHTSPWAADIYQRARARGKDHPHAIRILARAWVRVIWRCWLDGVPYNPTKHGAAAAFMEPQAA